MPRNSKKQNECFFVKEAAKWLDVQWRLIPREESNGGPDFIIHEGKNSFGLEVCQIFKGKVRSQGSKLKKEAVTNQKLINEIRQQYESMEDSVPLHVRFLGDVVEENKRKIVQTLLDMNLKEKSFLSLSERVLECTSGSIKIYVRRLPDGWKRDLLHRPNWFNVGDSVGWVEKDSDKISKAIERKSKKIVQYRKNVAHELGLADFENCDIRLLIVSDHLWSYGQVNLDKEQSYNLHEFNVVYFFPFPEKPIALRSS